MSHKSTGRGPSYGEFSFPSSDTTWVRGYARGGRVKTGAKPPAMTSMDAPMASGTGMAKPAPTMKPRANKGIKAQAPIGITMKQGGMVGKMASLDPKAKVSTTPKKMNVKSRLSAGTTATEMKQGGRIHSDAVADKKIVKKAMRMHDDQLHGGKETHLANLRRGGKIK